MQEYQVMITYTALVCIDVKANSEEEAKEKAQAKFRHPRFPKGVDIQDDESKYCGVLNMDESWNKINN